MKKSTVTEQKTNKFVWWGINWKVRVKNPYFWIGLIAVIFASIGIKPEMLTSWAILWEECKQLFSNPFALCCVIVAVICYVNDPTTKGIKDSEQALTYHAPKKEY